MDRSIILIIFPEREIIPLAYSDILCAYMLVDLITNLTVCFRKPVIYSDACTLQKQFGYFNQSVGYFKYPITVELKC